jgi:hypothetical protein
MLRLATIALLLILVSGCIISEKKERDQINDTKAKPTSFRQVPDQKEPFAPYCARTLTQREFAENP